MRTDALHAVFLCALLTPCLAYWKLKNLSYLKLPYSIARGVDSYKLFGETAVAAAYDRIHYKLYVIGSTSHLMHVVDLSSPDHISRVFSHSFTLGEGIPRAVTVCGDEVAVALSAHSTPVLEGHIRYYRTYTGIAQRLEQIGRTTVGEYPRDLQFTADCDDLVVVNEGVPGKDSANAFLDPEGTISIIRGEKTGNPSLKPVDFKAFNQRYDIRAPGMYAPSKTIPTVAQDLQPTAVALSEDERYAYVLLQDNDAIAKIDMNTNIASYIQPFPRKDWGNGRLIDTSDLDGGVHRRSYSSLKGIRMGGALKVLRIGRTDFLIVAEEGSVRSYSSAAHGFSWTDAVTAKSLAPSLDPSNTTLDFQNYAKNDEYLGRLQVSRIDGSTTKFGHTAYQTLQAFGGRGFSIWKEGDYTKPVFDSAGTIEAYMEVEEKSVFNTDCILTRAATASPETMRDTTSSAKGAQINTLDVMTDDGSNTTFLVMASKTTGVLFLYTVNMTGSTPTVSFQSVARSGTKDVPWNHLYQDGSIGDLHISSIGLIPSKHSPTDTPLLYVTANGSGSVSLYALEEASDSIPMVPIG